MAVIKCKMCGGDMEISADKTFGTCEYCGSTMTLPKVSDDQRAAAFNRGNHFRRAGEFDKALGVYERIVAEDDTDAEAHWCCALCRFGIEYVEDPATYEWLPTCHRASFDSFLEDVDYLAALEHSDGITRRQYQKDAAKIAEVQRGILATSQNTEPYDVFISYKELDENGERTRDSVLAQDIYYQLTEQGRRVFFSRISLEDIPGTQYEPYIFAALNSAKVMIVVGTSAENLNAVWVKNEWSRFLAMMRKDKSKLLIPCYRDMDPYDMPEQLTVLMSYDMGKIGFIQDLIRGVNKVLDADKPKEKEAVHETVVVKNEGGANIDALLKRAFLFIEDKEWDKADEYLENVLNIDPENGRAYLGKLCIEYCISSLSELSDINSDIEDSSNYQKARRFCSPDDCILLDDAVKHINARKEEERKNSLYALATEAKSNRNYDLAEKHFIELGNYKDSTQQAEECHRLMIEGKDAQERRRLQVKRGRQKAANVLKRIIVAVCCVLVIWIFILPGVLFACGKISLINRNYDVASKMFSASYKYGKYDFLGAEAMAKTGVYKAEGDDLYADEKYEEAAVMYAKAGMGTDICEECYQKAGEKYLDSKEYGKAIDAYEKANNKEAMNSAKVLYLEDNILAGEYNTSKELFDSLIASKYETDKTLELGYILAEKLYSTKDYGSAASIYEYIKDYNDSQEKYAACCYDYGIQLMDEKLYNEAAANFLEAGSYKDAPERVNEAKYAYGLETMQLGNWWEAMRIFRQLGDYSDSKEQFNETSYQYAISCYEKKDYDNAVSTFKNISGYKDATDKMHESMYMFAVKPETQNSSVAYTYLKELMSIGYKDSADIYKSRYSWKATVFFNESETDTKTVKTSISKYKTIYMHYTITSGPLNEGTPIYVTYQFPNGSVQYVETSEYSVYNGSTGSFFFWYNTPSLGSAGNFVVKMYTADGTLISEGTVFLSNS